MRNQKGFTLIELIIVIVVLGILAVTAAPQFINFSGDARASALKGMEGSIKGAMQLTYSKAAIDGVEEDDATAASTVEVKGAQVAVIFGYPAATASGLVEVLDADLSNTLDTDWVYEAVSGSPNTIVIAQSSAVEESDGGFANGDIADSNCYLTYKEADGTNSPATVEVSDDTGC